MSYYRSQKCKIPYFFNILENKLELTGHNPSVIIGDSNVDLIKGIQAGAFINLFHSYDFKSCHELVMRPNSFTCIDQVFSNVHGNISAI